MVQSSMALSIAAVLLLGLVVVITTEMERDG
jgi:hypothetical protein